MAFCGNCGTKLNGSESFCPNCGSRAGSNAKAAPKSNGTGTLCIYRMGSPIGIAAGFAVYIDGKANGYVENKQLRKIQLPYGTHNLHITCGMNRRCTDTAFTLSAEKPVFYVKARIQMGAFSSTVIIEPCTAAEMP